MSKFKTNGKLSRKWFKQVKKSWELFSQPESFFKSIFD